MPNLARFVVPAVALVCATTVRAQSPADRALAAADFLGPGQRRGVVAVGQRADLVLLDANPLTDIANSRRIAGVMLRGRWFSQSDIALMLEELRSDQN